MMSAPASAIAARVVLAEHVRRGEQVERARRADQLDLVRVAHPGLLEVRAEHAVDDADGGKVLDAREAELAEAAQEIVASAGTGRCR